MNEHNRAELQLMEAGRYADLMRGRRVAIVGPADTLVGRGQGTLIDSYDIVVRINGLWPVRPTLVQDYGSRTDVLYHCCNGEAPIANLRVRGFETLQFVWYEINAESPMLVELCRDRRVPVCCYDESRKALMRRLRTRPNTGTLAITHLLTTELAELHVTGFSFYSTRYYEGYLGTGAHWKYWLWRRPRSRIGTHKFPQQRRHFRMTYEADPRLTVDPILKELMKSW